MGTFSYIDQNIDHIFNKIEKACTDFHQPTPTVVAVTKSAPLEEVLALAKNPRIKDVAENRVELFNERRDALLKEGLQPHFHLIGSLQTNKVKGVIGKSDLIQSLDRTSLAIELQKQAQKKGIDVAVLLEVNSGREENKGGLLPEQLIDFAHEMYQYPNIKVYGLMTMGIATEDENTIQKCFRETKELYEHLVKEHYFQTDHPILSMGMSHSYIQAIKEGANMVRIGRAFFEKEKGE